MDGLNKVFLIGYLGRDPELKAVSKDIKVAEFSIATTRSWKDHKNETKSETDWHNVVSYGNQSAAIGKYLTKGSMVSVTGRIRTRSWEGPDGSKKYKTEIIADQVLFLDRNKETTTKAPSSVKDYSLDTYQAEEDPDDLPF